MKLSMSTKKSFYLLLVCLVLVLGGIGYTLYWANSQLESRSEVIQQKRAESDDLENKIANASTLKEELETVSDIIDATNGILPDTKSQENIVGELVQIANNRGLQLNSISFRGSSDTENPETSQTEKVDGVSGVFSIPIQTSIETNYENVLQFLEDLENNKRQFEVTDLSISPKENGDFAASLSIVTYVKP